MAISVTSYQLIGRHWGSAFPHHHHHQTKHMVIFQSRHGGIDIKVCGWKAVLVTLNCQIPHYETWPRYFPLMRYCLDDAHYHSNLSYALGLLWSSLSTFSLDFVCCNLCRSFIMRMELPWKPVAPGTIDCRSTADIDSTVDSPGPSFKSSRGECIYRVPLNKQVCHSLALHATEDPHKSKEG